MHTVIDDDPRPVRFVRPDDDVPRHRDWFAANLALLVALVPVPLLAVLTPAALLGWGTDSDSGLGESYLFIIAFLVITWPLYMTALAVLAPRVARPRRTALLLTPLLGAPLNIVLLLITLPDIAAAWALYLAYGALVRLPPGARARALASTYRHVALARAVRDPPAFGG